MRRGWSVYLCIYLFIFIVDPPRSPDPMSSVCARVSPLFVCPQMLRVALLCVCAVALGRASARSDSGNFLDDKWLTGRWDKFRDVSIVSGLSPPPPLHPIHPSTRARSEPLPLRSLRHSHPGWFEIMRSSFSMAAGRRVTRAPLLMVVTRSSVAPLRQEMNC